MKKIYTGEVFRGASFTPLRSYEVFEEEDYLLWGLTQNKFTKVDKDLFDFINSVTWGASRATNVTGWYVRGGGTNNLSSFKMHQYMAGLQRKVLDFEVDHINRDSLDNRKCNLRLADRRQQQFNLTKDKLLGYQRGKYTTKYAGVRQHVKSDNFQAFGNSLDGSWKGLGTHSTPEQAAKIRDEYMYEEYKYDFPLRGLVCNGILGEPTLNFIPFNFPKRLGL